MPFQIHPLPGDDFEHLFQMSDADLRAIGARRVTADAKPGFPCRVSLEDAEIGDEVILTNYTHLNENSPYKASHAVYVRRSAVPGNFRQDEVPDMLSWHLLSIRGFDRDHMIRQADVIEGTGLAHGLEVLFENPDIAYVHIHYAMRGCFAARATRQGEPGRD